MSKTACCSRSHHDCATLTAAFKFGFDNLRDIRTMVPTGGTVFAIRKCYVFIGLVFTCDQPDAHDAGCSPIRASSADMS